MLETSILLQLSPIKCSKCNNPLISVPINLEEVLFVCSGDQCYFPMEEKEDMINYIGERNTVYQYLLTRQKERNTLQENPHKKRKLNDEYFSAIQWGVHPEQSRYIKKVIKSCGQPHSTVVGFSENLNHDITVSDLLTLLPGVWLCEEVINTYMFLICNRFRRIDFLCSYFVDVLVTEEQSIHPNDPNKNTTSRVNNWKNVKLTMKKFLEQEIETVFIPIHLTDHWILIALDRKRGLIAFDSLARVSGRTKEIQILQQWINKYLPRNSQGEEKSNWNLTCIIHQPHQSLDIDSYNCGIYTLLYAQSFCLGKTLDQIGQEKMDLPLIQQFRDAILIRIVKLLPCDLSKINI